MKHTLLFYMMKDIIVEFYLKAWRLEWHVLFSVILFKNFPLILFSTVVLFPNINILA